MSSFWDNSVGEIGCAGDLDVVGQALPPSTSPFLLVATSSVLSLREQLSCPLKDKHIETVRELVKAAECPCNHILTLVSQHRTQHHVKASL